MSEQLIHQILTKHWGFSSFRSLQKEIILSVLDGIDTLALLPTGGGKSICFQVPAMAKDGICLVISPLIALMKDQVENLNKKNIPAIAVISGMSRNEIDTALDNCIYGKVKFLYVSPERLSSEIFIERLPSMKVNLLAVDLEAPFKGRPEIIPFFAVMLHLARRDDAGCRHHSRRPRQER